MEQRFLLESEGVRFTGRRVDLREFEHRFAAPARKSTRRSFAAGSRHTAR